jgi:hypothetical protein
MKKIIFIITTALLSIVLARCEKETDIELEKEITFLRTDLGGCHDQDFAAIRSAKEEIKDTVIFTVKNDTLDVYVGLNYICCAPFTSDAVTSRDTIIMILSDTCNFPEESCYCKCMCYYTWNFLYTGFGEKEYQYKIILHNPREEKPVVISEGKIVG